MVDRKPPTPPYPNIHLQATRNCKQNYLVYNYAPPPPTIHITWGWGCAHGYYIQVRKAYHHQHEHHHHFNGLDSSFQVLFLSKFLNKNTRFDNTKRNRSRDNDKQADKETERKTTLPYWCRNRSTKTVTSRWSAWNRTSYRGTHDHDAAFVVPAAGCACSFLLQDDFRARLDGREAGPHSCKAACRRSPCNSSLSRFFLRKSAG